MKPQFTHDCTHCQLIGQAKGIDVYACTDTLIGRTGNQGPDYTTISKRIVDRLRNEPQGCLSPEYQLILAAYAHCLWAAAVGL